MITIIRDGQKYNFEDPNELFAFMAEKMVFASDVDELKERVGGIEGQVGTLKGDMASMEKRLTDRMDKLETKIDAVKYDTATLLRDKGLISKTEGLEYIQGKV